MWVPKSEAEINTVVGSKQLEESDTFDAKQELPKTAEELAKDVAAMATDGGVLIYGIGEDANKRPTVLTPVPLANSAERIDALIRSNIQEPPRVIITTIPTATDPSVGYIIVLIPPSPRAPHMVMYRGDNSFYGRSPTGNKKLTEGEVARLYARRQQWEVDSNQLLTQEIASAPIEPHPDYSYLYGFIRPVFPDEGMLQRIGVNSSPNPLNNLFVSMSRDKIYPENHYPFLYTPMSWVRRSEGYLGIMNPTDDNDPRKRKSLLNVQLDFDGTGHLFCARAAEREGNGRPFIFFPEVVAGTTSRFLGVMGHLYRDSSYYGMIDVGVALTGLRGVVPNPSKDLGFALSLTNKPYDREEYRKTLRISALELPSQAQQIAHRLLMPLIQAVTQSSYNPFPDVR